MGDNLGKKVLHLIAHFGSSLVAFGYRISCLNIGFFNCSIVLSCEFFQRKADTELEKLGKPNRAFRRRLEIGLELVRG